MNHASSSTSRSGCGCGGGATAALRAGNVSGGGHSTKGGCSCGGASGGSCGCGGACGCGDGACQPQDFARPRFFAGQLLTEDDLDLLGSYVVEKNRLHNRSFFGEGVVCGLMVTCDPCGDGKIAVQPGYALDCCGNDIVVPCPQTLDVNAMVRRLRIERTGGIDCGDPCSDAKSRRAGGAAGTGANVVKKDDVAADATVVAPPLAPAEFCLYVRYCEQNTDPVSPYATDDPCGVQACEPTRVREGFNFELRCRNCDEEEPDSVFAQIARCLGGLVSSEKTARNLRTMGLYQPRLTKALAMTDGVDLTPTLFGVDRLAEMDRALKSAAALPDSGASWAAADVYEAADAAQTMASVVAAWSTMTAAKQAAVIKTAPAVPGQVKSAQAALERLEKITPRDRVAALIADPLDRTLVTATAERAVAWARPAEVIKTMAGGERDLLIRGVVLDRRMRSAMYMSMAQAKATLVERIRDRRISTDCSLLRDAMSIVIPEDDGGAVDYSAAASTSSASEQLLDVYVRYLRECICSAFNPPCPPCDDPAVLLACLRVEECDVKDICNLERTFVLTPVAMRYWMPFLRWFGNALEQACCPSALCDPPQATATQSPDEVTAFRVRSQGVAYSRGYAERNSALYRADRFMMDRGAFGLSALAATLPTRLAFSSENAQRLVTTTAAVVDLISLRGGAPPGDFLSMLFTAPTPVSPAPAVPAPAEPAPQGTNLEGLRNDVNDLNAKLKVADERNARLEAVNARFEARLKKLEG